MRLDIFISSLALALVFLPLLAWKWCIKGSVAVIGAIFIGGLTALITNLIASAAAWLPLMLLVIIEFASICLITVLIFAARFYRDPERTPAEKANVIISPADGTVIYINKIEKGSSLVSTKKGRKFRLDEIMATDLLSDGAYLIGIDMNVLNVHVNRSPIAGKAVLRQRTEGSFISLRKPESEAVNERVTTIISNGTFKVGVVQIASRLVRRIVSYVKEGDNLELGQRIGAIVFGSQVDVAVPDLQNLRLAVKPGDEVKAGVTVIARYGDL